MTAQVAADLRAAADVLERDGWTQRTYEAVNGCHCAAGAVFAALAIHPADAAGDRDLDRAIAAFDALLSFLRLDTSTPEGGVIVWNDAPERTAAEVIAALRAAADAAEATP